MEFVIIPWTAFSNFMETNGREVLTSVAFLITCCFLSAICYFLYRLLEIIHWREVLNWRSCSLKSWFRNEEDNGDENDDENEDEDEDEDSKKYNANLDAAIKTISELSDEEIRVIARMITEEKKKGCKSENTKETKPHEK